MVEKRFIHAVLLVTMVTNIYTLSENDLLPFGSNYAGTANEITTNVHGSFENASLLDSYARVMVQAQYTPFRILGVDLTRQIFINFNGHITFGKNYDSFAPLPLNETNRDIIAVYFSDNDLRRPDGLLHHRFTTDTNDLKYADDLIHKEGFTNYASQYCIVATWDKVKFYVSIASERANPELQAENTYQVVICTDGNEGHIIYQYVKLEWSKSQDQETKPAQAGWYFSTSPQEDYKHYALPNTGTTGITGIASSSNIREPQVNGRWMRSAPNNKCYGKNDGVYAANCTTYFYCCGGLVENMSTCRSGSVFHPQNKYCVESSVYPCGENVINFCDGRQDGRYENTLTEEKTDFYQCTKGLTRILTCPTGIEFDTGNPRCTS